MAKKTIPGRRRTANKRISGKIKRLRGEGVPRSQAVATALNMERKGRLTKAGGYRRVKRASKRKK